MQELPEISNAGLAILSNFHDSLKLGETTPLSPADKSQNDFIRLALQIGGFTADKYPALYKTLDAGVAAKAGPADRLMLVDAGKTDEGKATATVWVSVDGATLINGGVLFAFDAETGALVACGENTALNQGFLTCPTRAAQARAAPKSLSLLHLSHVTDPAGQARFFAMAAQAEAGDGIQAQVTQPVILNQGHTQVEISVGRTSSHQNNDCDYIYYWTGSNDNNPYLICPFVGSVYLSGSPDLSQLTEQNLITNIVTDDGSGGSRTIDLNPQYTTSQRLIDALTIGDAPNKLEWSYAYDGPNKNYTDTSSIVYNRSNLQSEIQSYFYYMFNIPMQDGQPNQVFYVCSKDSPERKSVNCTEIDNLLFWWHCAVAGTPVTLESGETLAIEEIDNGHRVRSADGRTWAVRATRYGTHRSGADAAGLAALYRIETADGHRLSASGAHAIALAAGGFRQICDIAVGDEVATLDGTAAITVHEVIAYDGMCYSLAIGDDDEMTTDAYPTEAAIYFAGGIGCGDHMAMRAQTQRARHDLDGILTRVDASLHKDCRSAFADRRF